MYNSRGNNITLRASHDGDEKGPRANQAVLFDSVGLDTIGNKLTAYFSGSAAAWNHLIGFQSKEYPGKTTPVTTRDLDITVDISGVTDWRGAADGGIFEDMFVVWSFTLDNKVKPLTDDHWTDVNIRILGTNQYPANKPLISVLSRQSITGKLFFDSATCTAFNCLELSLPGFSIASR